jgi:16S rRNA (cytidine1402-2'-O)-methyltransferase
MTLPASDPSNPIGTLWLIPTLLGDQADPALSLPAGVVERCGRINHFLVENAKSSRAFIKRVAPDRPLQAIAMIEFDKETQAAELLEALAVLRAGHDVGVLSEAGLPCIADPGANVVRAARTMGARIAPMVGPSSLMLALMASGLQGQRFRFLGYLPVDAAARALAIRDSEKASRTCHETQMAIETPYRNASLLKDLASTLAPDTLLTVASDLTLPEESILTRPAKDWRSSPAPAKRPTMFLWLARSSAR